MGEPCIWRSHNHAIHYLNGNRKTQVVKTNKVRSLCNLNCPLPLFLVAQESQPVHIYLGHWERSKSFHYIMAYVSRPVRKFSGETPMVPYAIAGIVEWNL